MSVCGHFLFLSDYTRMQVRIKFKQMLKEREKEHVQHVLSPPRDKTLGVSDCFPPLAPSRCSHGNRPSCPAKLGP